MKAERLNYLDMAKGIGIILVVIGHTGMTSDGVMAWISSFHMPLFMIISGMILCHSKEEKRTFSHSMKKKALSLLVPYGFFSIIYLFISLYYFMKGRDIQPVDSLLQTVSFFGISVLWFLPALFIGEALFLAIRKHTSRPVTAVCCIILCPILLFLKELYTQHYLPGENLLFLWLGLLMATLLRGGIALLFVAMGYYVMCLLEKLESSRELSYIWYFLSAMAFALVNWIAISVNGGVDLRYMTFNNSALYFCGAFSGSMAVICLCRTLPALKLLSYLGTNSLIIMVTHLDCFVMYIALKFADFMSQMIPFGKEFILWLCTALALFFMEIIIIYIVNHFFPFFLGRRRRKE